MLLSKLMIIINQYHRPSNDIHSLDVHCTVETLELDSESGGASSCKCPSPLQLVQQGGV